MEAGQRDELELVAHGAQLALEAGDRRVVQIGLPVERRRAVVGQHLAWIVAPHGLCKALGLAKIRLRRLAPDEVGIGREGDRPGNARLQAVFHPVEAFRRAPGVVVDERPVALVDVGGQELGRFRVGAADHQGRHAAHIRRQPRRRQVANMRLSWDQHLAAEMAAFLFRRQLVLEMDAGGAGLDKGLHQFKRIERPAEAGFRIGDDRRIPGFHRARPFRRLDLVGALQGAIDAARQFRAGIGRIERLVGIHGAGDIGVGRHLPARQIDRLQPGAHHLHGLVARHGAEAVDEIVFVKQPPQPVGAVFGKRVAERQRAAQPRHVVTRIGPLDTLKAAGRRAGNKIVEGRHGCIPHRWSLLVAEPVVAALSPPYRSPGLPLPPRRPPRK